MGDVKENKFVLFWNELIAEKCSKWLFIDRKVRCWAKSLFAYWIHLIRWMLSLRINKESEKHIAIWFQCSPNINNNNNNKLIFGLCTTNYEVNNISTYLLLSFFCGRPNLCVKLNRKKSTFFQPHFLFECNVCWNFLL